MTLDEKLDVFYNSAIQTATEQSSQIIEEYKASLKNVYDDKETNLRRMAASRLHIESDSLLRDKNKRLSSTALDIRKRTTEKMDELKEILFADVKNRLISFMETPEYTAYLIGKLNDAVSFAQGDVMTLYINPSDAGKKSVLEGSTGLTVTISKTDFMGGLRAVIHEKNILIDNSFKTKLAEQKETFTLS